MTQLLFQRNAKFYSLVQPDIIYLGPCQVCNVASLYVSFRNMSDFEEKKEAVKERLQRRDEERLAELQQRKTEKEASTAKNETGKFFNDQFQKSKKDITNGLGRSREVAKDELRVHFDTLSLSLQKLQKFVSDSSVFLTARDLRKSQTILQELQTTIQVKRDEMIPKKKFAFKSKKKEAKPNAEDMKAETPKAAAVMVGMVDCNFAGRRSETLIMDANEVNNHDIALSDLVDCTVKLYGSPSAVHIDKLERCTVLCGPVSGSIFIDECVDSNFVLACQQLRIHNTTRTKFYIHVTSKAIIEDCSGVCFAPYAWTYEGLETDYSASGLDKATNNWSDIDDFDWLASDKESPNWNILAEDDRSVWT